MSTPDWISLLSTIGTIGATVVALWLALRGNQRRIDGTFIWEAATNYQPTLLVQNTSNRIAVIESVEIYYRNQNVCTVKASESFELSKYAIIESGQVQKIPMNEFISKFPKPTDVKRKYRLKTIIKQQNGWRCVFATKLSYDELQERFSGQVLFEEPRYSL